MNNDFDDYELQEKISDLDKMERVLQAKQQRDFARAANNAVAAGIAEALKDAGLSQEDWGRIYFSDPETTLAKQKVQAKKFASKIISKAKAKGERDPQGRFVSPGAGRKPSSSSKVDHPSRDSIEARRASADKALNDFFLQTLRK